MSVNKYKNEVSALRDIPDSVVQLITPIEIIKKEFAEIGEKINFELNGIRLVDSTLIEE